MPRHLDCRPELELPVAVLKVAGELDMVTAAALRRAVRTCLAAQPTAMLIDVADLDVREPLALASFAAVARESERWPAAPIVLCGPRPATVIQLRDSPVRRAVAVAGSCAEALARTRIDRPLPRLRSRLRPMPDACRQARQLVSDACAAWRVGDLLAVGAVIATELVANVVRHARTTMDLTLALRAGRFSVAVRDRSDSMPRAADPGPADVGGRGLRLIRELSDGWGVLPVLDGKVVWANLAMRAGTGL
jgi:anti-anti-sigma regulatory factor